MSGWLDDVRLAFGLLTRIPMPHPDGPTPGYLGRAHRAFPLVGAVIGGVIGLVYALLLKTGMPALAAAALALGAGLWLTGCIHEDGLADMADGFGGGRDKAAKLEIMRDSRIGTYGTMVSLVAFAAKLAALASLSASVAVFAMIAVHALSRAPLPAVTLLLPPARPDGLAASAAAAGAPDGVIAVTAYALAFLIALVCLPPGAASAAAIIAALAVGAIAWLARRQVEGYTGDVLGAAQQVAEVALLLFLAVRLGAH